MRGRAAAVWTSVVRRQRRPWTLVAAAAATTTAAVAAAGVCSTDRCPSTAATKTTTTTTTTLVPSSSTIVALGSGLFRGIASGKDSYVWSSSSSSGSRSGSRSRCEGSETKDETTSLRSNNKNESFHFLLRRQRTLQERMQDATEETSATTLDERFDVDWEHPLGHGSFGTVYTGVDKKTHEAVAVKEISKALTDNAAFEREMEALWRLRDSGGHPNICGLREHFDDTSTIKQHQRGRGEGGYYYLVLDRVEGCEMFDALIAQGAYSEADAARLIQEAASALDYLHGIHIVHGDLKPENLMLSSHNASDSVIKVVDFGCAQVGTISSSSSNDEGEVAHEEENNEKDDNNYNILGHARRPGLPPNTNSINHKTAVTRTPAYCPPEILEMQCRCDGGSDDGDHRIDSSFDMWSLGVILFVMLTGMHPFDIYGNATDNDIERAILSKKSPPLRNSTITAHLSDDAISLIEQLLDWDPEKRLTAHQVLENPWVRGETASNDKMANSHKRLSKYRAFQSKLERKVFSDMVSGARITTSVENRESLIEHAFRSLDRGHKGYVTTTDLQKITKQTQTGLMGEICEDEQLSLSGFADLMSETMKNRYYPKGHVIYHEGDTGECMFFLNSGAIEVFSTDGFSKILRTPGAYFGEGALMDPKKIRSASIRCVTPVHAIEVSREYFEKYMAEDNDLKANLREVNNSRKQQRANAVLQLQQSLEAKTVQRGDFIFREKEPGDELYILETGQVDTTINGHKVYSVRQKGDIFGEHSLVFRRPRNSSAQCQSEECKLHVLKSDDFNQILKSHPSMKDSIRNMCLRREFQKGVCVKSRRPFPDNQDDLRAAFDAVDVDKIGRLEYRNVRNVIERLDSRFTEGEIRDILQSLDLDDNGAVTWEEFKLIFGMETKDRR